MTSSVRVMMRVKATPERAFDVFTQEIGAWWRPDVMFQTTPRAPGVLAFDGQARLTETLANGKVFEIGRVTAWKRPERLVFTWRQAAFPVDLYTEVEVTFTPIGAETRVSINHRGFDRVPVDSAARHAMPDRILLKYLADYWRDQLAALGERSSRSDEKPA